MAVDQDSDLAFERRYRLVQHIGWGLMALFLLLALTGVFGTLLGHLIVRALVIYLGVLVLFRIAGRRTMAQITPFDLVLLLIISEAVQPALLGDTSLLEAFVLVTTLVGADILLGELSQRSRRIERLVDGTPIILVQDGQPLPDRLRSTHVTEADLLAAARDEGLTGLDQIRYAILEATGRISIIAR